MMRLSTAGNTVEIVGYIFSHLFVASTYSLHVRHKRLDVGGGGRVLDWNDHRLLSPHHTALITSLAVT